MTVLMSNVRIMVLAKMESILSNVSARLGIVVTCALLVGGIHIQ